MTKAYINKIAQFLPNRPVLNDEMEEYLGKIKGLKSKSKAIILRHNGIKTRYYALDKEGKPTHTTTDMAVEAIQQLADENFKLNDIDLLSCGSASPDIMMPGMACMVHGQLGIPAVDAMTATGSCNSAMWALNYAFMKVITGQSKNAVCAASERMSSWMMAKNFEEESKHLEALGENPYVAFEKEFLRWMLSDGAGAVLIQDKPNHEGLSLQIDWIEIKSFANQAETCMYAGGEKDKNGNIIPWRDFEAHEWTECSIFALRQDAKLLEKYITKFGGKYLVELLAKHKFDLADVDYFMPHLSSFFFKKHIKASLEDEGLDIPDEKWFLNLDKVGNVAAASGFIMLHELFHSGRLQKGQKILMMIPESARFSYTYMHLTVV